MTKNPPVAATVAAIAIAGAVQTLMLEPSAIAPSPTNPRKTFPPESLLELADSLKRDGQVHAILVRPMSVDNLMAWNKLHPGFEGERPQYEIVSGERRWRAAEMGGIQIRAEVRELTDLQVVRLQIIENLHREEVHPLEEAEGYEYLLHKSGEKISIDQIADEVGKSRSYVYQRMKLAALCPDARKAFLAGGFDASTALLVARFTPQLQVRAIGDIANMGEGDNTPSYRQIRAMLRERYQLQLAEAVFDITDAKLVPACGACTACPKRTGNQPMLFADVDNPDVCTDPDCFADKRRAHHAKAIEVARTKGIRIIEGEDAKEVDPHGSSYLTDHNALEDGLAYGGEGKDVTYGDVMQRMGKKAPKPAILVRPTTGEAVPVITDEESDAVREFYWAEQRKADKGTTGDKRKPESDADRERREKHEAMMRQHALNRAYGDVLRKALGEKAKDTRTSEDIMVMIFAMAQEVDDDFLEAAGLPPSGDESEEQLELAVLERMKTMGARGLATLGMRIAVQQVWNLHPAVLEAAAQSHGIDTAKLLKQAEKTVAANEDDDE